MQQLRLYFAVALLYMFRVMHGTTNIKFIDAQQAKLAYQYKNTKRKKKLLMMGGIVTRNM